MKSACLSFLLFISSGFFSTIQSQSLLFVVDSVATASLQGTRFGSAAWGDYDNDGDLDFVLTGEDTASIAVTRLFQNQGGGAFLPVSAGFTGVRSGGSAWSDFDNNGSLDLALVGLNTDDTPFAGIYLNAGSNFTLAASLPGLTRSSVASADFNGDGRVDLAISGLNATGQAVTKVYFNNGSGFDDSRIALTGVSEGALNAADFDNDGLTDLFVTGRVNSSFSLARVYFNTGGSFSQSASSSFTGVAKSASAPGDFDQDGDLDLLISGITASQDTVTRIYRNNGGRTAFSEIQTGLPGFASGSVAWGDLDNDGDLDIFLTGLNRAGVSTTAFFTNEGSEVFSPANESLTGVSDGVGRFADIDADGDLDMLLAGADTSGSVTAQIFLNLVSTPNTVPTSPQNLNATLTGSALVLSWQPANDDRTAGSGLTYNLRVGSTPGGSDIVSQLSQSTGLRKVVALGNTFESTSISIPAKTINKFPQVFWSVQAIDNSFAGSAFAEEKVVAIPFVEDVTASSGLAGVNASASDWGDFDNDGDLDILITGQDATNQRISRLFRNDDGQFTGLNLSLAGVAAGAVAWGDYNGDGRLDILLTGFSVQNTGISKVYRNDGSTFTDIAAEMVGVYQSSVDWGDFDNDGDLDILLTGLAADGTSMAKIYRNDDGVFHDANAGLTGVSGGTARWGDLENDGDLDVLLTGTSATGEGSVAKLYRNQDGVLSEIDANLPGVTTSSAAWGDYDNDGDQDILLAGATTSGRITVIFRNDGNGQFEDIQAGLDGISNGGVAWGDFDSDGDLDVALSGFDNQFTRISKIYSNDNGVFTDINAFLDGVIFGSTSWADYDSDQDLDILLTGSSLTTRIAKIYENPTNVANTRPQTPTGLQADFTETSLIFRWQAASDAETPQSGLTYNLRVGTAPGAADIVADMSLASGFRTVSKIGNAGTATQSEVKISSILSYPNIFWSVQTVDATFAGSEFASEEAFGPQITSVTDIPNDEGNKVLVKWKASSLDYDVNHLTSYTVWRAVPESFGASISEKQNTKMRTTRLAGNSRTWEWLATIPAHRWDTYAFTASTFYDSSAATDGKHYFLVSAHTGDPNIFFDSLPDSGSSIDNLAPAAPVVLASELNDGHVNLRWQKNSEADFKQYLVFKSNTPGIDVTSMAPFAQTRDTTLSFNEMAPESDLYFVVAAQDSSDNLSLANEEIAVLAYGAGAGLPAAFALQQNYPNPFNPSTQIRFSLAEATAVKLEVFNVLGERVATLVDEQMAAGEHSIEYSARDLPSGSYFYKIAAGNFIQVRKMVLMR